MTVTLEPLAKSTQKLSVEKKIYICFRRLKMTQLMK